LQEACAREIPARSYTRAVNLARLQLSRFAGVIDFRRSLAAAIMLSPTPIWTKHGVPGRVKLAGALATHGDLIAAAIIFERYVQRLMNVSGPMS
jgi:hypothetical protein